MKTIEEYLKKSDNCPFCDHGVVTGFGIDSDDIHAYREVVCYKCDKKWTEVFTITSIEEVI
jgi:transcription elongation factor Elf1